MCQRLNDGEAEAIKHCLWAQLNLSPHSTNTRACVCVCVSASVCEYKTSESKQSSEQKVKVLPQRCFLCLVLKGWTLSMWGVCVVYTVCVYIPYHEITRTHTHSCTRIQIRHTRTRHHEENPSCLTPWWMLRGSTKISFTQTVKLNAANDDRYRGAAAGSVCVVCV